MPRPTVREGSIGRPDCRRRRAARRRAHRGARRDRPATRWSSSVTRTGASRRLAERLARAADEGSLVALEAERIADPRLRQAFSQLADRVADTWSLATVDPLTGIANRQAVLARLDEELAAREPVPPPAVGDHHRPRPLQAAQRRPRPRGRATPSCAMSGSGSRRASAPSTSRAATAARSSWSSCPRRGPTRPRRWPRSCAGSSAAAEVRLPGRRARQRHAVGRGRRRHRARCWTSTRWSATRTRRSTPRRRSVATRSTCSARPATRARCAGRRSAPRPAPGRSTSAGPRWTPRRTR